jgi:hypothetical protein
MTRMVMLLLRQTQGDRERKEERVRVGRGGEGRKSHRGLAGTEVAGDDGDADWGQRGRIWSQSRLLLRREFDGEGRALVVVRHGRCRKVKRERKGSSSRL